MTVEDFKKHFNVDVMEKGLGGRFLYFIDTEKKQMNPVAPKKIPRHIVDFAKNSMKPDNSNILRTIKEVVVDPRTEKRIDEVVRYLDDMKLKMDETDKKAPIYNRLAQTFIKMALIHSYSESANPYDLSIKSASVDWSLSFIDSYKTNMGIFIDENLTQSFDEFIMNEYVNFIKKSNSSGVTLTDMARKYSLKKITKDKSKRKIVLDTLIEDGTIFKKEDRYFHHLFVKKV
jgi:hypothetical protein